MPTIAIAGDVYPGAITSGALIARDVDSVFDGLLPVIRGCDYALANLEGPLVETPSPIFKIGPCHRMDVGILAGLHSGGFRAVNLANNHAMDHGWAGIQTTIDTCAKVGMDHLGAGADLSTASRPLVRVIGGRRVGFLSYTEHEFGIATRAEAGTNPLNVMEFVRNITECRRECEFIVVLIHGGNEYYPYPRPNLQEMCRFLVEQGANAVICQHSHCAGCSEEYRGGHIVYGQGNLIFDDRDYPCEEEGVVVLLRFGEAAGNGMELVPYRARQGAPGVRLMDAPERTKFMTAFDARSKEVLSPEFVEARWKQFCLSSPYNYLSLAQGYPKRVRELDRRFGFLRFVYSRKRLSMLLHLLRCESHHEAIKGALKATLG